MAVVALVLTFSVPSAALAAQSHRGPTTRTTTASARIKSQSPATTLPRVPAKAEPLLRRLLKVAALVSADDQRAAELSQSYDLEKYKLSEAKREVAKLDSEIRVDDVRLSVVELASAKLRSWPMSRAS